MKRLGPELKMPEMKVPPMLKDLYDDLRDRRLLPLLGLILVAIIAVPFLLSESPETHRPDPGGVGVDQGAEQASALTVAEATPGLRDYRKRLNHREPTNPFKQRYTAPMTKGAELPSTSSSTTTSSSSSTTSEGSGGSEPAPVPLPDDIEEGGGSGSPGSADPGLRVFTFTIKVQISRTEEDENGEVKMGEPNVREGVRPLTSLPGEKAPVVTYLGANLETGKAIFMVSKDVTAAFGDAKCVSGTDSCELMEIERGFPETFEYGPNKVRYKINVLDIDIARAQNSQ